MVSSKYIGPLRNPTTLLKPGDLNKGLISGNLMWTLSYCWFGSNIWPCVTNGLVISQIIGAATNVVPLDQVLPLAGTINNGSISFIYTPGDDHMSLTFEAYGNNAGSTLRLDTRLYWCSVGISDDGKIQAYNPQIPGYQNLETTSIFSVSDIPHTYTSTLYTRYLFTSVIISEYDNMILLTPIGRSTTSSSVIMDSVLNSTPQSVSFSKEYSTQKMIQRELSYSGTTTDNFGVSVTVQIGSGGGLTSLVYTPTVTTTFSYEHDTSSTNTDDTINATTTTNTITLTTDIPSNTRLVVSKIQNMTISSYNTIIPLSACYPMFGFCKYLNSSILVNVTIMEIYEDVSMKFM